MKYNDKKFQNFVLLPFFFPLYDLKNVFFTKLWFVMN